MLYVATTGNPNASGREGAAAWDDGWGGQVVTHVLSADVAQSVSGTCAQTINKTCVKYNVSSLSISTVLATQKELVVS